MRDKVRGGDDMERGGATLGCCAERIPTPRYERSEPRMGIVHVGVGGFHRSHKAAYIDRLLNGGLAREWAIGGIGVLESDDAIHRDLAAQECPYTLIERENADYRVIGSLVTHLYATADPYAAVKSSRAPRYPDRLTDDHRGRLRGRSDHVPIPTGARGIADDLPRDPTPWTVFGLVTAALARRRAEARPPFTIVSCNSLKAQRSRHGSSAR
jgi:mannitol 2-dehydrogenase